MINEVYNIQIFANTFIYSSYIIEDKTKYNFVIHPDLDQSQELFNHLNRDGFLHIGYNNLKYGYLILHNFLENFWENRGNPISITFQLFCKAQQLLNFDNEPEYIKDKDMFIRQIDLMSILHLSYTHKYTSLNDVQYYLGTKNINNFSKPMDSYLNLDEVGKVVDYNDKDVYSIYQLYKIVRGKTNNPIYKNIDELKLRVGIKNKFGINCLNYSNVKIGEQLILNLYCKETGFEWSNVRTWQTDRPYVDLATCIPHYCNLKSIAFNNVLNQIKVATVDTSIMKFETTAIFHGIKINVGCGGLHASCKPGIYKSDDKYTIISLDFASLYPHIAKVCKLYPEHLGVTFNNIYPPFIEERMKEKAKADRDESLVRGYKLILNSVGGKTNEKKSFLLDQQYFLRLTFGGQILTMMWMEALVESCKDIKFLLCNTDGLEILCPNDKVDIIHKKCEDFARSLGFIIESNIYKQLIVKNVNEYIAEYSDSTPEKEHLKLKGCFEIYKEIQKDPSMRIIPIALKQYFINKIPISHTIKNHKNILDFCMRLRINNSSKAKFSYLNNDRVEVVDLPKTTRYFCSNNGGSITVAFNGDTYNRLNKDFNFTLFNEYYDSDNYDINYQYYISEANKIKDVIEDMQLNLF